VPRARAAEAEAIAAAVADGTVVGDPFDAGTNLGPLVSAMQRDRVLGHLGAGEAEGAGLVAGGTRPPEGLERGSILRPTVFGGVGPGLTIAREEICGPVLCVLPYNDEEDAIRIANDSPYGLAGGVWSADEELALRVARR